MVSLRLGACLKEETSVREKNSISLSLLTMPLMKIGMVTGNTERQTVSWPRRARAEKRLAAVKLPSSSTTYNPTVAVVTMMVDTLARKAITDQKKESLRRNLSSRCLASSILASITPSRQPSLTVFMPCMASVDLNIRAS